MAYIGKSPDGTGVRSRFYYTQTSGGGTSVSGSSDDGTTLAFSDGAYVDVFLNGVLLVAGTDYNTSTANTIAGLAALANGDVIEVVVYDIFTVADTVSSLNGGTFSNSVTIDKDGGTVLTVDRATDNGAVIDIQKDGTSVGSVQSRGGAVTSVIFDPRSNGAGMTGTTNAILPTNQAGAIGDGTAVVDLGASGYRYRDMFLSGNIYLGGTGSANALDDFEEGSHVPTVTGSVSGSLTLHSSYNTLAYTKIGRVVHVQGLLIATSVSAGTGYIKITLPFAITSAYTGRTASATFINASSANARDFVSLTIENESQLRVYLGDGTSAANDSFQTISANSSDMYVSLTYITDS